MIKKPTIIKDDQKNERVNDVKLFELTADLTTMASICNIIYVLRSPMLKQELTIFSEALQSRVEKMHKAVSDEHILREHDRAEIKRQNEKEIKSDE